MLSTVAPAERSGLARVKRFLEWVTADGSVRERLESEPASVAAELGLDLDIERLRPLWDRRQHGQDLGVPAVRSYRAFAEEKRALRRAFREGSTPRHEGLRAWRERQIHRCDGELAQDTHDAIIHAPAAIELSRGCSVGCWFCGVGAGKLAEVVPYEPGLWQGILGELGSLPGPAAGHAFCYWATDPLDNPEYERFCLDFHRVLGRFPQTTTALPLRDPRRTRRLLELSTAHGCPLNRFSILSLGQLRRLFQEFSPEELLRVELVMQNRESLLKKAYAGKARASSRYAEPEPHAGSTIACVSGFLVHLAERTVQLVSPCSACDRWPLGYRVHAYGSFRNPEEFGSLLRQLTGRRFMPARLELDQTIGFRADLAYEELPDGFRLAARHLQLTFSERAYPRMRPLGREVRSGSRTVAEIALEMGEDLLSETFFVLEELFRLGTLEKEPVPAELEP